MSVVVIADAERGLKPALDEIFASYGGIESVITRDVGTVYIEPNGVHFALHSHTDPAVLEAVLSYLRDRGYDRLAVMESCTAGNVSRPVLESPAMAASATDTGPKQFIWTRGQPSSWTCGTARASTPRGVSTTRLSGGTRILRSALSTSAYPSWKRTRCQRSRWVSGTSKRFL